MQDILKALDTLTNDEREAVIDRAEEILQEQVRKVPPEDPRHWDVGKPPSRRWY